MMAKEDIVQVIKKVIEENECCLGYYGTDEGVRDAAEAVFAELSDNGVLKLPA